MKLPVESEMEIGAVQRHLMSLLERAVAARHFTFGVEVKRLTADRLEVLVKAGETVRFVVRDKRTEPDK
jgi:plastocyanin